MVRNKRKNEKKNEKKEEKTGTEEENMDGIMEYLRPSSPKVISLYEAVRALSREGADLTQLKVSDIAAKAGIGKGTTYEYFKSREELIVKAVLYNVYNHTQIVEDKIQQQKGFQKKIYIILDTLFEAGGDDKNLFQRLMPFFYDIGSFPARFREEFKKYASGMKNVECIGQILLRDAMEEGILQEGLNLFYMQTALFNTILNYAIFRQQSRCREMNPGLTDEEVRQRLYENLVYALRK